MSLDTDLPSSTCTGPFTRATGRTGWWTGWTAISTTNVARTTTDWFNVSNAVTSPDCVTDMVFTADSGNHLLYTRRNRAYVWLDYRLLINGVAVLTRTYDKYFHKDERDDTNPDVITPPHYDIIPMGPFVDGRLAVAASAPVQVQARQRYQVVASQTSAYFRYIGGLRSSAHFTFTPRVLVQQ